MSDMTIGSDPEFVILDISEDVTVADHKRLVRADSLFTRRAKKVGLDGSPTTGELRPDAADSPADALKAVERVVRLLDRRLPERMEKYEHEHSWRTRDRDYHFGAGAGTLVKDLPIGGHVHFGAPRIDDYVVQIRNALNFAVAAPFLRVEVKRSRDTRLRDHYYGLLDHRCTSTPEWATMSEPGLEWRPLPSWLVGPKYAEAIFHTTYAITDAIRKGFDQPRTLEPRFDAEAYRTSDRDVFNHDYVMEAHRWATKLPLYPDYREQIDTFYGFCLLGVPWDEGSNFIPRWVDEPRSKPTKVEAAAAEVAKGLEQRQSQGEIRETASQAVAEVNLVRYNGGDHNVEEITRSWRTGGEPSDAYPRHPVIVYGVSSGRGSNIVWVSHHFSSIRSELNLAMSRYNIQVAVQDTPVEQRLEDPVAGVGLSHNLRERPTHARRVLRSLFRAINHNATTLAAATPRPSSN